MEKDVNAWKKYILEKSMSIQFCGHTLYRVRALTAFGFNGFTWPAVHMGELGGYVESEANLSQNGPYWIAGEAKVFENAFVCGGAVVCGVATVCDDSIVKGVARVRDHAWVGGRAVITEEAEICDAAVISYQAVVRGKSRVCGSAHIIGTVELNAKNRDMITESDYDRMEI